MDPHGGQPTEPTKPRTTPTPPTKDNPEATRIYLSCIFEFYPIVKLCLPQRTCLASQVLSNPGIVATAENLLILICLITLFQATGAYMISSSQIMYLTLDSYHCSRLNTLSFRSTQMVQRVMSRKRCKFFTILPNLYEILSPNKTCF